MQFVLFKDENILENAQRIEIESNFSKYFKENNPNVNSGSLSNSNVTIRSSIDPSKDLKINGQYLLQNEIFQTLIDKRGGGKTDEEKLERLQESPIEIHFREDILKLFIGYLSIGMMHVDGNNLQKIQELLEAANVLRIQPVLLNCMDIMFDSFSQEKAMEYAIENNFVFMASLIPKWTKIHGQRTVIMHGLSQSEHHHHIFEKKHKCPSNLQLDCLDLTKELKKIKKQKCEKSVQNDPEENKASKIELKLQMKKQKLEGKTKTKWTKIGVVKCEKHNKLPNPNKEDIQVLRRSVRRIRKMRPINKKKSPAVPEVEVKIEVDDISQPRSPSDNFINSLENMPLTTNNTDSDI